MHHPEETFLQHSGMILINDDDNDDDNNYDNGGMMVSPGLRYETGSIGGKNGGIKPESIISRPTSKRNFI